MDDMIRAFAQTIDQYTELHDKCWSATPEECKELMTMKFPLIQHLQMQLNIEKIGKMPYDPAKAGKQVREYAESGAASNNGFNLTPPSDGAS